MNVGYFDHEFPSLRQKTKQSENRSPPRQYAKQSENRSPPWQCAKQSENRSPPRQCAMGMGTAIYVFRTLIRPYTKSYFGLFAKLL
jgi:hypothetical protein